MNPPEKIAVGTELSVRIEKVVYGGLGLSRHDGQVVFVARGLPGDLLAVRVVSRSSGFLRAVPITRLEDGAGRRTAPCPASYWCGGCAYQELDYAGQLALKAEVLRESLARAAVAWTGELRITPSPERGWRTRMSLHCQAGPAGVRLGLHEEGSHRVVEFDECLQVSPRMNQTVLALRKALSARPALAARVETVDLAESGDGEEAVAVVSGRFHGRDAPALASLLGEIPGLTGAGAIEERGRVRTYLPLGGQPFVHASVLGTPLRAHARSFFQANRFLVEDLARAVVDLVPEGGTALDLFCGVGLFALSLATRAERVLGAETNPLAVEDAIANGRGFDNARFFDLDVRDALTRWPREPGERIVLDPPRRGLEPEVVAAVVKRRPEVVVYVSCDPPTLARDLARFADAGFIPDRLMAFDMFPDTFHVETVVRLVPA